MLTQISNLHNLYIIFIRILPKSNQNLEVALKAYKKISTSNVVPFGRYRINSHTYIHTYIHTHRHHLKNGQYGCQITYEKALTTNVFTMNYLKSILKSSIANYFYSIHRIIPNI